MYPLAKQKMHLWLRMVREKRRKTLWTSFIRVPEAGKAALRLLRRFSRAWQRTGDYLCRMKSQSLMWNRKNFLPWPIRKQPMRWWSCFLRITRRKNWKPALPEPMTASLTRRRLHRWQRSATLIIWNFFTAVPLLLKIWRFPSCRIWWPRQQRKTMSIKRL